MKPPSPPPIPPPPTMPDPEAPEVMEAARRKANDIQTRAGRRSTILSSASY